jgi:ribosomal protein S18 acetylase RimI-like enzyme
VDEAFHRANLGIRLYRRLEQRLRKDGVRMMIADTDAENEPAIAFFKAIGFSDSSQHVWLVKTIRRPNKGNAKSENSSATN